jgi:hypothetical protein
MDRSRGWKLVVGALVLVVAASCGGGGDDSEATPSAPVDEAIAVTPGAVTVSSAGPQIGVDDATRDQMIDVVKQYVQLATVDPLRSGHVAKVAPLFTAAAAARAEGADRAVLVDEDLPRATSDISATAVPVPITVLVDQSGALVLASAGLDLTVATKTADGPVEIHRVGSLTFAPDAGSWKVAGFDLAVNRTGAGVDAAVRAGDSTSTSTKG